MLGEIEILNYINCFRIEKTVLLISLDRVMPFWEEMELNFSHPDQVKQAARPFVIEQQKLDIINKFDYFNAISVLLNNLFQSIRVFEGEEGVSTLHKCIGRFIMYENESTWRSAWHGLMFQLEVSQEPVLIRLGLPEEKIHALLRLTDRYGDLASELEDLIDEAENQPLQGWDEEQYRIYRKESDDVSPLDYLSNHLLALRFHKVWHEIQALLKPDEMEILSQWGQYITALKGRIPPANAIIPEKYRALT
jgi:hypothetical protein